jgi:hypothetical protein
MTHEVIQPAQFREGPVTAVVTDHKQGPKQGALQKPKNGVKPPGIQGIGGDVEGHYQAHIPQEVSEGSPRGGLKTLVWNGVF